MAERFGRLTERARRVLTLAEAEARSMNHNYIGTEHLLAALVGEGDGVAAKVLANLGVELEKIRTAIEFIIGHGRQRVTDKIGFTPRANKVIGLAGDEARRLGHHYIGTEHVLLGLVDEGEGLGAGILESLGVSEAAVRAEVDRVLAPVTASLRGVGTVRAKAVIERWDTSRSYSDLAALRNALAHLGVAADEAPPVPMRARRMSVAPVFGGRSFVLDDQLCFVLMPFEDQLRPVYDDHIRKVVEQCGLRCLRADDVFDPGQIMEQIWDLINRARLIIVDLTGKNPNVFYEMGIVHTVGKPVILMTQSEDDVPFDLRPFRYILYEYTPRGCQDLERKLREAIQAVVGPRRG
jgi:hypothetical protein